MQQYGLLQGRGTEHGVGVLERAGFRADQGGFSSHTPRLEPYIVNDQWQGICWYRKVVDIPRGKHVLVRFEGAMNVADLWVNSHYAGRHMGGYLPYVCDITRVMKENGDFSPQAVLKIRLDNNDNPVTGPKPLKLLDFNMYGGLYRNARLIIKSPLHITDPILENTPAGGGCFSYLPGCFTGLGFGRGADPYPV